MNLLTPLYLAGIAAVSLPILFHFLRRAPRSVLPYSSLMFLSPSPPRLTRRSRIDHWLLLLLRALALILLAIAFCRPFQREDSALAWGTAPGRRVAILVDTSASMRQAGLWDQVQREVGEVLDKLNPQDTVALFAFDRELRAVADFSDDRQAAAIEAGAVRAGLKSLEPSWAETSLGAALVGLAERLESLDDRLGAEQALQIVLVSDLQEGARLQELQAVSWPERVAVDVRQVQSEEPNASVHVLQRSLEDTDPHAARLRVVNNGKSPAQLRLRWSVGDKRNGATSAQKVEQAGDNELVEAPAAGSKVVRSRRHESLLDADRVVLEGDAHEFDNVCYVLPPLRRRVRLVFWGDESATDAEGLRLYFENAAATAPHHDLRVEALAAQDLPAVDSLSSADLVVVTAALGGPQAQRAAAAVRSGARLLLPLRDASWQDALAPLLPADAQCELEEASGEYALWSDIDFDHPMFTPLASARYSDFTKVRFWRHRRMNWSGSRDGLHAVARFDNGDLAIAQWTLGEGEVTALASGWHPRDSQLAVSTKFVPLAASLLDGHRERAARQFEVFDSVPRAAIDADAKGLMIETPRGDVVPWPDTAEQFTGADAPGVYWARWQGGEQALAVNLAPDESRTTPLPQDELSKHGVRLGQSVALGQIERQRQRKEAELESRQKLWQWLIAGVIAVLLLETLLGARFARRLDAPAANV